MGSQVYGVATLRGGKSLPSIKRRILLCGKSEVIIRFIRNMALALISSSSWKVAENTAKSDCLIFRAQLSSGSAIKGAFAPLFFFSHFAQYAAGILCLSPMDVSHLWMSPTHGRPYSAHKCLSLAGGPRAGASRSARAEF